MNFLKFCRSLTISILYTFNCFKLSKIFFFLLLQTFLIGLSFRLELARMLNSLIQSKHKQKSIISGEFFFYFVYVIINCCFYHNNDNNNFNSEHKQFNVLLNTNLYLDAERENKMLFLFVVIGQLYFK